jgi:DNA-binding NtrC family response regulator
VLWLDGDPWFAASYVDELEERGFVVEYHDDVDLALRAVARPVFPFDLVLWDLSLPPGHAFKASPTRGGLLTGRFLFDRLHARHPQVPTLLFTNFRAVAAEWNSPSDRRYALAKARVLPDELADGVEGLLR